MVDLKIRSLSKVKPSATPLHQKLYGGLDDLKKTTNFNTAAGLVV